jgi:hypothetical protein
MEMLGDNEVAPAITIIVFKDRGVQICLFYLLVVYLTTLLISEDA